MSSIGNFFICTLIDAMRQVLWVMAFIRLTSMYFAAGAPGGPFPFADQDQRKLQFLDLFHQTAVGVTFNYAKPPALFKNLALHKCQSEKQAYAVMKQNKEQKDLIYSGVCRADAHAAFRYLWSAECS